MTKKELIEEAREHARYLECTLAPDFERNGYTSTANDFMNSANLLMLLIEEIEFEEK